MFDDDTERNSTYQVYISLGMLTMQMIQRHGVDQAWVAVLVELHPG